jgi:hypothetical protein
MDKLREMLTMDPCYEQHIVTIKEIYEKYLFSILTPAIYEGYQSLYKRSYEIEQKYVIAAKKNPNIENPGILVIFQSLIREIPNLNNIRMRMETDRIKSSSKSAELFDDLVRAVCKSNIILLTYNIDHKRKDLIKTKYHENINIYDFIHSSYNYSARLFFGCPELFYHKMEPIVLNQNKRTCYKIIKEGIEEAIRMMLPMKDILLEYNTQKYEQKEKNYFAPHGHLNINGFQQIHPGTEPNYYHQIKPPSGVSQDEYVDVNQLLERDLQKHQTGTSNGLLEDDYDPEQELGDNNNAFGPDLYKSQTNDFSLLLSNSSDSYNENNGKKLHNDIEASSNNNNSDNSSNSNTSSNTSDNNDDSSKKNTPLDILSDEKKIDNSMNSNLGLKMIDISGSISKKGAASTYFNETMPDIKRRMIEYKQKKTKSPMETTNNTNNTNSKKDIEDIENIEDIEDIKITRSQPADLSLSPNKSKTSSKDIKDKKKAPIKGKTNNDVDNMVDDLLKV